MVLQYACTVLHVSSVFSLLAGWGLVVPAAVVVLAMAGLRTWARFCPYCHGAAWYHGEPRPRGTLDGHGCCVRCGGYPMGGSA